MVSEAQALQQAIEQKDAIYRQMFAQSVDPDLNSFYDNPSGTHHDRLFDKCYELVKAGINHDLLDELVKDYCERTGHDTKDGYNIVRDVWRYLNKQKAVSGQKTQAFRVWDMGKLLQQPIPDISWLVDKLIQSQTCFMISADSGIGKTWLAVYLAVCIVLGVPAFVSPESYQHTAFVDLNSPGRVCAKNNVFYLAAEGGRNSIQRKVKSILAAFGFRADDITGKFYVSDEQPNLTDPEEQKRLLENIRQTIGDSGVVIVDTFIRVCGGAEENSSTKMSSVTTWLAEELAHKHGYTVIVLHHTTKDGKTFRGSSEIKAAMDCVINLKRNADGSTSFYIEKQNRDEDIRRLTYNKFDVKDGDNPENVKSFYLKEITVSEGRDRDNSVESAILYVIDNSSKRLPLTKFIGKVREVLAEPPYNMPRVGKDAVEKCLSALEERRVIEAYQDRPGRGNPLYYRRLFDDVL